MSARIVASIVIIASLIAVAGWVYRGYGTIWQWWLAISVSSVFGVLTIISKNMRVIASGLICLLCVVSALFASALSNYQASLLNISTQPFEAYKIAALTFAIVAVRPLWVGYFVISACSVVPLALYFSIFAPFHKTMPLQEPWMITTFSIVSLWLYRFRIRSIETERNLARARAREEALGRIANVIVAVRDLSNTPIQTLVATTALLERDDASRIEISRINKHALHRLRELSRILETYEHQIDWSHIPGSFEARAVLKEALKENGW